MSCLNKYSLLRVIRFLFSMRSVPINYLNFLVSNIEGSFPKIIGRFLIINKGGTIIFGNSIRVNSSRYANIIGGDTRASLVVEEGAELRLGNDVSISNSTICCANKIVIGNNVMIGGDCRIWDSDFHPISHVQRKSTPNDNFITRPVIIGDNVFIGGGSIILKGVRIGQNSVIGAGSVVTGCVGDNEVWAGNPARLIRRMQC